MTARYSLCLSVAMLFAMFFVADAHAQDRTIGSASVVEVETVDRGSKILRHFDPDAEGVIYASDGAGYVFGTNNWGDLGFAVGFEVADLMQVLSVNAYIFRAASPVMSQYEVAVYEGAIETGPLTPVAVEAYDITHIETVEGDLPVLPTMHEFGAPIPVIGAFFVAFQWDANHGDTDLGGVSSEFLDFTSPYEWVQEFDGTWTLFEALWGESAHVWVEVEVQEPVSSEPGAEPRTFTLSSVYPNPAAGTSHINLDMDKSQHISVEVFNLLGQRVATVFEGSAPAGRSVVPVDASGLTAGIYVVRVVGEDFSQSRKFVVSN